MLSHYIRLYYIILLYYYIIILVYYDIIIPRSDKCSLGSLGENWELPAVIAGFLAYEFAIGSLVSKALNISRAVLIMSALKCRRRQRGAKGARRRAGMYVLAVVHKQIRSIRISFPQIIWFGAHVRGSINCGSVSCGKMFNHRFAATRASKMPPGGGTGKGVFSGPPHPKHQKLKYKLN